MSYFRAGIRLAAIAAAVSIAACTATSAQNTTETAMQPQPVEADSQTKSADVVTGPVAATQYGQVSGETIEGVHVFRGIPYGADTSETRFQRANPPAAWDGVRESVTYPDTIWQTGISTQLFSSWQPDPEPPMSEDVLGLNVWTPGLDDHKRPVMVWLHGGGFQSGNGSSTAYEGVNLANRGDVVVVTINHRLNAFGYLYLAGLEGGDAYPDSGNIGNLDMVMALEWVRDNIAEFGGNPDNVLIFGESGGGRKVSTLLAMEEAKGLIDRAVVQSGSHLEIRSAEEATEQTRAYLDALGVSEDNLAELETISAEAMKAALSEAPSVYFSPVLDGTNFKHHPATPEGLAISRDVPMMIGSNDDELSIFMMGNPAVWSIDYDGIAPILAGSDMVTGADQAMVDEYRALFPDQSPTELLFTIASDLRYGHNAVLQARAKSQAGGAPAWLYLFDWETPVADGRLGTPHALEIPFAFDTLENSESMVGDPAAAQPVADQVSEAWISFARHGDPNARGLPFWPAYSEQASPVMRFNTVSTAETGYFADEIAILETE